MSTDFRASWLTRNQGAIIVLLTMGMGLVASFSLGIFDIWLAPPLVAYTALIHIVLALAWLLVLIVCAIRRPPGWRGSLGLFLGSGFLTGSYLFFLMVPYLTIPFLIESAECQQTLFPNNQVCYTCPSLLDSSQQMKGSVGSILVRPIRYPEVCQPGG
jgi:hypothetical protein